MRGKTRGLSLVYTLLLSALLITAAFAMTSSSIVHLSVSNRLDHSRRASALAEAAAQLALARLAADQGFGLSGSVDQRSVVATFQGAPGEGRATFDATRAAQWELPPSFNGLASTGTTAGYQRTLAPHTAQIIAEGRSGGVVRHLEVVVTLPPYKYALASKGTIQSNGGLKILGVKDPSAAAGGVQNIPADQLQPGHVASNGNSNNSLKLHSDPLKPTLVTGDAQTSGTVQLGPSTTVEGAVKEHSEPAAIPDIDIGSFDPGSLGSVNQLAEGIHTSSLTAAGVVRRQGNLQVTQGGLDMEGAYLYVNGDLDVWGGLRGTGVVFATGAIRIHGQSSFVANEVQALVAGGDLVLDGLSQNGSYFQGLAYTEGNFTASDLTMVGSFIGAGPGTSITLDRTNVVHSPKTLVFDFGNPVFQPFVPPAPSLLQHPDLPVAFGVGPKFATYEWKVADPGGLFNQGQDAFDPTLATTAEVHLTVGEQQNPSNRVTGNLDTVAAWMAAQTGQPVAVVKAALQQASQTPTDYYRTVLAQQIADMNELYQQSKLQSLQKGSFALDPNQFVQISDRLRKVLWREF